MKKIIFALTLICCILSVIPIEYSYAGVKEDKITKDMEAKVKGASEDELCQYLSAPFYPTNFSRSMDKYSSYLYHKRSSGIYDKLITIIREELLNRHLEIPNDVRSRIKAREIWIGMETKYALLSRGKPRHINRTTTATGISEQWVYKGYQDGNYLYFDNDKLKAWQN